VKKLLLCLFLASLLLFALGGTAQAQPPTLAATPLDNASTPPLGNASTPWLALADPVAPPTVSAIDPATAPNDIDTPVTITGTGFATDATGTIPPRVNLGGTALANVTLVDSTTLTATVPWGIDPGARSLTVVNSDGSSSGPLTNAFAVTQGIGHWNGGNLFGGDVRQILMKPDDPATLYALAYNVGLFRSVDAGETWTFVWGNVIGNRDFVVDPGNPTWLYSCAWDGLYRSTNEGDTWTRLMTTWPGGSALNTGEVYVSPHDSQVLFVSSYFETLGGGTPPAGAASGLIKSTDGGTSWAIVQDMKDKNVESVAFDPNDDQKMVLATSDGTVYRSTNGGSGWDLLTNQPSLPGGLGFLGTIHYNRYTAGEVWITSVTPGGIFKTDMDATTPTWQDVTTTNSLGVGGVTFTGADSVYVGGDHSTDGGTSWHSFGPSTNTGCFTFDPADPLTGYAGDGAYGVQKTTDGGTSWAVKKEGLAGMVCSTLDVSPADPLRVYATLGDPSGIYRSLDGADTWSYRAIPGAVNVGLVRADPLDSQRVYVASHTDFYTSTDGGTTWSDLGFDATPAPPGGVTVIIGVAPDPFQAGHLLLSLATGPYETGPGYLYESSDYGATWQQVAMPQDQGRITDITFDPTTQGLVYLTSSGTGVYGSAQGGASGTWTRIDDQQQQGMQNASNVAIATHPQPVLFVQGSSPYRSLDGGATWQEAQSSPPGVISYMFANADSTRLYAATFFGLYVSSDVGDTWTQAAGALGQLKVTALGYGAATDHTIIYAATSGGAASGISAPVARRGNAAGIRAAAGLPRAGAAGSTHVDAGIYRYVALPKATVTLKLTGLKRGALRLGGRVAPKGVVTPSRLAGSKVKLTVQRWAHRWVTVKTALRTISAGHAYSWAYKPAKRGSYRMQATIATTATHTAAKTPWRVFKVK
jgi:photosystem II stability/assembly factor-like uncharacterized protein